MKKKIIMNRIMIFYGLYVLISLILLYYSFVFTVVFPNAINNLLFITILIVVCILPYLIYRRVILPARHLDKSIRQFHQGGNSQGLKSNPYVHTEEMNLMFDHVLKLSENVQSVRVSNLHSEYRALQNQINPHFLYNTLEAVRSDALIAGNKEIADITESLATFFRYTISNIESMVTLEDELVNVKNYFKIQNYRFGDKIRLSISYGDKLDLLKTTLPKLILQPIVENAILHGLEYKVDSGQIVIKVHETQNRVLIDVIDDGVGMTEDLVDKINRRMAFVDDHILERKMKKGGIALVNVNNRIKLTFGQAYGLRLSSVHGYGTTVNISLPKKMDLS
ncbi:sensor histidine kinase [Acidaminobacter sp. JC074]|uniref:sensor histidine kinase n=1 Tax=Acidaminobacter sp. JC074 TaxID=2530199 RepID=UPI001F115A4E|nr:histidine kinase [Acidaminobacter sp. JC074]MCH4887951.1 sensor histidine kinase [Acidaminobacter sp. JC074]